MKLKRKTEGANRLSGGVDEFLHVFWKNSDSALILLEIPIDKVKDIDFAFKKANEAGFKASVLTWNGYRYLHIDKAYYSKEDDQEVVKKLKEVAIAVSTEDYSNHIRQLKFEAIYK